MNEEEVFQAARSISDPRQRQDFVEQACAGDTVLVERIGRLLRVCTEDKTFLASPAMESLDSTISEPFETVGSFAGPYRLVELIGEGGFGLVYRAEQQQPVKRSVAVKLIKPGMDTRQTVARFQAEQQALALMNHPHIAGIFDCGQTASGRPWFAMEYMPGVSITTLADQQTMNIRQRLAMMIDVCNAVEHAHQKGVIHRDLKPSNILVNQSNGQLNLKVIDFGIAKAIQGSLSGGATLTQGACMMGTPLYMSPEQLCSSPHDVDTRSDIYSLGVILYELITGRTPLDRNRLANCSFDQLITIIRENEPLRPSQFYRDTVATASTSATNRGMTTSSLASICRQDLDWIVMKCLERDRHRRYQSVTELRADLQRYLNGEVVLAGPPSTFWQLRKLVRRYQTLFVTGTLVFVSLVLGLVLSSYQAVRASRAEVLAKIEKEAAQAEQKRADDENQIAQAVTRFVIDDLLGQADIANQSGESSRDPDISAKELVRRASQRVGTRFSSQPGTEVAIRRTLSSAWLALGEIPKALEQAREAGRLSAMLYQPDDRQRQLSNQVLALALIESGQSAEAIRLATEVRDYYQSQLGEEHMDTQRAIGLLASALNTGGKLQESEELLKQTLAQRQRILGVDHIETLRASYNLAAVQSKLGKLSQAETVFREILTQRVKSQLMDHPEAVREQLALASVLQQQEKLVESEQFYMQAEETAKKLLGEDHPTTISIANDLANLYSSTQREELAGQLYQKVLDARRRKLGDRHPDTWDAMNNLAIFKSERGEEDQALALLTEVATKRKDTDGLAHPDTVLALNNLAYLHHRLGNDDLALPAYQEAIEGAQEILPKDHPILITLKTNTAIALMNLEKAYESETLLREALSSSRNYYGESTKEVATSLGRLAMSLYAQEKFEEAEPIAREQLSIRLQIHPELWTTAWAKSLVGTILSAKNQTQEAQKALVEGATFISENIDKIPPQGMNNAKQSLDWVIEFFEKTGDQESVQFWRAAREAKFPPSE